MKLTCFKCTKPIEEENNKRFDFDKGGSAILACFMDVIVLLWVIGSSIAWVVWLDPVTKWMVGIDGDVFRSTFTTYVNMENVTSGVLSDGEPRKEYIYLNVALDISLSVVQLMVTFVMICIGPIPKHKKSAARGCYLWLAVNVSIMIGYLIWRIIDQNWVTLIMGVVIRGLFTHKIYEFAVELHRFF